MTTIKAYTDLEQSKRLAKILPIESADMFLALNGTIPVMSKYIDDGLVTADNTAIPCWSLAALLELMSDKIVVNDENYFLNFTKKRVEYRGIVTWDGQKCFSKEAENLLDAVFEMVCWLKENKKI